MRETQQTAGEGTTNRPSRRLAGRLFFIRERTMDMEKLTIELIVNSINAAGTFLLGISAVIGIPRIIRGLSIRNETLYGDEAVERYNQIKEKLSKDSSVKLPPVEFGGEYNRTKTGIEKNILRRANNGG
jgi:hypothetical protein